MSIVPPAGPRAGGGAGSATLIANETGFPDLIVPAGITKDGLPVSMSFFGPAYSEAKLIGYGYDFEQGHQGSYAPEIHASVAIGQNQLLRSSPQRLAPGTGS